MCIRDSLYCAPWGSGFRLLQFIANFHQQYAEHVLPLAIHLAPQTIYSVVSGADFY